MIPMIPVDNTAPLEWWGNGGGVTLGATGGLIIAIAVIMTPLWLNLALTWPIPSEYVRERRYRRRVRRLIRKAHTS